MGLSSAILWLAGAAAASCGADGCVDSPVAQSSMARRSFKIGYEFEYVDQDQPRAGASPAAVGSIPGHHNEVYTVNRTHRLILGAGLTDRWSAELRLPFVSRTHQHVHNHRGARLDQGWTFSGLGDLAVSTQYEFWRIAGGPAFSAIAGAEFPTGESEPRNSAGETAEASLAPGSASYDWSGGLGLRWGPVFASGIYRTHGRGRRGYRLGDVFEAGAGVAAPLAFRTTGSLALLGRIRGRDDRGSTREETDKTGGEALFLCPGLTFPLARSLAAGLTVHLPIYQRVNLIQTAPRYALVSSLTWRLGAP